MLRADEDYYCCFTNNRRVPSTVSKYYESTMPTQRLQNEKNLNLSNSDGAHKNKERNTLKQKVSLSKLSTKNKSTNFFPIEQNFQQTNTTIKKVSFTPQTPSAPYSHSNNFSNAFIPKNYCMTPKIGQQFHNKTKQIAASNFSTNNYLTQAEKQKNVKMFVAQYKQYPIKIPAFIARKPEQKKIEENIKMNEYIYPQENKRMEKNQNEMSILQSYASQKSKNKSHSARKVNDEYQMKIKMQQKLRKSSKASLSHQQPKQNYEEIMQEKESARRVSQKSIENFNSSEVFTHLGKKANTAMSICDDSLAESQLAFLSRKNTGLDFRRPDNEKNKRMQESIIIMDFFNPPDKLKQQIEEDLRIRKEI